jgi:hypothetical protein
MQPQAMQNNNRDALGQNPESMGHHFASQVQQATMGFNPQQANNNANHHHFNNGAQQGNLLHPNAAMMVQYTPIQPSVASQSAAAPGQPQQQCMVGTTNLNQGWNHATVSHANSMQANIAGAAYQIPSNWGGTTQQLGMQSQGNNQVIPSQGAATQHKPSNSRKKSRSGATPDATTSGTSVVPPDPEMENPKRGRMPKRRPSIDDFSGAEDSMDDDPSGGPTTKVEQNRERNREHARSTRLRKKAYVHKLKEMADGLRAIQTEEIRQRRLAVHQMSEMQKTRKRLIQKFLHYHANYEEDPHAWHALVDDNFWLKQPVTPFRSFRRSEVARVRTTLSRTLLSASQIIMTHLTLFVFYDS